MKKFEVHITGKDKSINDALDTMGIKNIVVDLLTPEFKSIRLEHMSSFVCEFERYEECFKYVQDLANKLPNVTRVKIESPLYEEYITRSIYIESHFKYDGNNPSFPLSQNVKSGKIIATDRAYLKSEYNSFIQKWAHAEVELCLYDDFIREDFDWFELYRIKNDAQIADTPIISTSTFLDVFLSKGIPVGKITAFIGYSNLDRFKK